MIRQNASSLCTRRARGDMDVAPRMSSAETSSNGGYKRPRGNASHLGSNSRNAGISGGVDGGGDDDDDNDDRDKRNSQQSIFFAEHDFATDEADQEVSISEEESGVERNEIMQKGEEAVHNAQLPPKRKSIKTNRLTYSSKNSTNTPGKSTDAIRLQRRRDAFKLSKAQSQSTIDLDEGDNNSTTAQQGATAQRCQLAQAAKPAPNALPAKTASKPRQKTVPNKPTKSFYQNAELGMRARQASSTPSLAITQSSGVGVSFSGMQFSTTVPFESTTIKHTPQALIIHQHPYDYFAQEHVNATGASVGSRARTSPVQDFSSTVVSSPSAYSQSAAVEFMRDSPIFSEGENVRFLHKLCT